MARVASGGHPHPHPHPQHAGMQVMVPRTSLARQAAVPSLAVVARTSLGEEVFSVRQAALEAICLPNLALQPS